MQDIPSFDPISYWKYLGWGYRLFILLLIVFLANSVIRSLRVLTKLWSGRSGRKETRFSWEVSGIESIQADLLARSGLRNDFPAEMTGPLEPAAAKARARIVCEANCRFKYLWELCSASVASIAKQVPVTLLLSGFVLAAGAVEASGQLNPWKGRILAWLLFNTSEVFPLIAMALLTCTVVQAMSSFCNSVLVRRKARWDYFVSRAEKHRLD
jgi:hypothetical protein